jgi:hypothetical protein
MILVILVGLSAFAMLAAWFLHVDSTTLWPLGEEAREAFWRRTLPWPRGVQEDVEIAWHVPRQVPAVEAPRTAVIGKPVPPTRPQRRIASR